MTEPTAAEYALGHSEHEQRRLMHQAEYWHDTTMHLFAKAGLAPGMRVLDVGCGVGDVTLTAASIVGESGAVLGIDWSADAVATARARAGHLPNVSFEVADINDLRLETSFDAIVGRLVLVYQKDPATTLRRILQHLTAKGIVAFLEMNATYARSVPACPLFDAALSSIVGAFGTTGLEVDLGNQLWRVFRDAGLHPVQMFLHHRIEAPPARATSEYFAKAVQTLLPLAAKMGIEVDPALMSDHLALDLQTESETHQSTFLSPALVGAWALFPGNAQA